jgi:hypothetical protein
MIHPRLSHPTQHDTASSQDVVDPGLGVISDHLLQISYRLATQVR